MADTPNLLLKIAGKYQLRANNNPVFIAGFDAQGNPVPLTLSASGGLTIGGTQRTPSVMWTDEEGSVEAGAKSVTFIFAPDFTGTILGVAYSGDVDASQDFDAPIGDTLAAIDYTVTAGSIRIVTIV